MSDTIIHTVDIETTPSSSQDDPDRREVLWASRAEALVHRIRDESTSQSAKHDKAGWRARRLYHLLGLPAVIIPLAGSVAAQYLPEAAISAMMLASGVCAGVSAFLNYSQKAQMHFEYGARWAELASIVDFELAKSRADRCAVDMYLERLRNMTTSLRSAEPPVA
jgi:hypothetical protein